MDDFEKIKRLLFQYNRELTREKGLFLTKKQLSQLDTVDFSDFVKWNMGGARDGPGGAALTKTSYEIREWGKDEIAAADHLFEESGAFAFVPCYSEAVIGLGSQWIHQRVERLDLDSMEMDIHFQKYQNSRGYWEPEPPVTFTLYLDNCFAHLRKVFEWCSLDGDGGRGDKGKRKRDDPPDFKFVDCMTYLDVYRLLPEFSQSLAADERKTWMRVLEGCKRAKQTEVESYSKYPYVFTHINLRINAYLAAKSRTHKRARAQTDAGAKGAKDARVDAKDTQVAENAGRQGGDNVRRVSLQVRFSGKRPAVPTSKSVRKWKTAQWKVRGHMRHYKDGRKVWIKERVCHRKDMNEAKIGAQSRRNVLILEGGGRA